MGKYLDTRILVKGSMLEMSIHTLILRLELMKIHLQASMWKVRLASPGSGFSKKHYFPEFQIYFT